MTCRKRSPECYGGQGFRSSAVPLGADWQQQAGHYGRRTIGLTRTEKPLCSVQETVGGNSVIHNVSRSSNCFNACLFCPAMAENTFNRLGKCSDKSSAKNRDSWTLTCPHKCMGTEPNPLSSPFTSSPVLALHQEPLTQKPLKKTPASRSSLQCFGPRSMMLRQNKPVLGRVRGQTLNSLRGLKVTRNPSNVSQLEVTSGASSSSTHVRPLIHTHVQRGNLCFVACVSPAWGRGGPRAGQLEAQSVEGVRRSVVGGRPDPQRCPRPFAPGLPSDRDVPLGRLSEGLTALRNLTHRDGVEDVEG
ncbi:uncharacterized protein LOC129361191 [Poeciliopsis prolifica]|uniref:uncharacterized protein LOC129361191 n=1 Tax=Poeciliopsis prolifica TaxID=188132 RepID=UPI0024135ECB|nr:uncharacterized protein LOC129361191 [Poeciliopsis prolifica]